MKDILKAIGNGLAKKGIVRVYWNYQKTTDVYADSEKFYGYERMTSTHEKLCRIPDNAEIDEIFDYEDIRDITLKEKEK